MERKKCYIFCAWNWLMHSLFMRKKMTSRLIAHFVCCETLYFVVKKAFWFYLVAFAKPHNANSNVVFYWLKRKWIFFTLVFSSSKLIITNLMLIINCSPVIAVIEIAHIYNSIPALYYILFDNVNVANLIQLLDILCCSFDIFIYIYRAHQLCIYENNSCSIIRTPM